MLTPLPARRSDLRIESGVIAGQHVVKDQLSGAFFLIGDEELFLLTQLDGQKDAAAVRDAYVGRFAEPLPSEDLDAFVETARERGMLTNSIAPPKPRQHVLYWRRRVLNPSRAFAWLEPRLRWCWTPAFVFVCLMLLSAAALVVWGNAGEMARSMRDSLRWDSLLYGWVALLVVGLLHECAHGLTCKHYGGEVREIGVLMMCFMPCFYCDVSDAWLIRARRQRVYVMLAGVFANLVTWSAAALIWRVAQPGTIGHRLAFLMLGFSSAGCLFNLNPLLKLDGYYILSDWLELPNLQQRALERVAAHLRHLLWGGPAVAPDPRGRVLTTFGILHWLFVAAMLAIGITLGTAWLWESLGALGLLLSIFLTVPAVRGLFHGLFRGEFAVMLTRRRLRTFAWLLLLAGGAVAATCIHVDAWVGGPFTVRAGVREEVRCRIKGFVDRICVREGQAVAAGDLIGHIDVPDLESRLQQKRAELREAEAQMRLLTSASRPEVIAEQRERVQRLEKWCIQGQDSLQRTQKAIEAELASFDERHTEANIAVGTALAARERTRALFEQHAAPSKDLEETDRALSIARARLSLVDAEKRALAARGTLAAEEELLRRQKELGDERGKLVLLETGGRPEEIAAQDARVDRLEVELQFLERQRARCEIRSAVTGVVVTSHLEERVGSYVEDGDLICCIEAVEGQRAEIALDEAKLACVRLGQTVTFKARALAFDTLQGTVTGIASYADKEELTAQSSVLVYCSMPPGCTVLRTAMSGHARIYTDRRSLAGVALDSVLRLVRTEFWW